MTPLGSFAVTFGCFALPSFLHWKLVPNMTTGQKVVDWILNVIGIDSWDDVVYTGTITE